MPCPPTASANGGRAGPLTLIGRAIAIDHVVLTMQRCAIGCEPWRMRGAVLAIGGFSSCCVGMANDQGAIESTASIARKV